MVKHILNIALLIFLNANLYAQTTEQIDKKNIELNGIRSEIGKLENELSEKKKIEKESLAVLENINQQSLLLNRLINKLVIEENAKEREIQKITFEIDSVEASMKKLKGEYAKYVVWVYKQGPNSLLKFLVNAGSFNQAMLRYKYLSYITSKHEQILEELATKKNILIELNAKLGVELHDKEVLVTQKNKEQSTLSNKKDEKQNLITNLKKDQKAIENEIIEKQRAEIQIKNFITKLVEEERKRLARLREAKLKNEKTPVAYDYDYSGFENFTSLKGSLGWPVTGGSIVRKFGENRNEKLNTVTLNYGVDIKTNSTSDVVAVAEGIVSAINWIPGYGSIVILTHKNEFRTVYGHLADIKVQEGDHISGGTKIGVVDESLEGRVMHFEIWNERNYQNPEVWLVKK